MSCSIFNKKCATLLLCSTRAAASGGIKEAVATAGLTKFMEKYFFPNLKASNEIQESLKAGSVIWAWILLLASVAAIGLFIYFIFLSISEIISTTGGSAADFASLYENFSQNMFFFQIGQLIIIFLFWITRYFRPGFLYRRLFESLPINLYFFLVLGMLMFLFTVIYEITLKIFKQISKKIRSSVSILTKFPGLPFIITSLLTLATFYLLSGIIGSLIGASWIPLASLLLSSSLALLIFVF